MDWQNLLSNQRLDEKPKAHQPGRSAFEQDFDRIIFSYPFRRLQDKTQVHPLPDQDFIHNRLTHSLEVSSVGRSLGKEVGNVILQREKRLAGAFTTHDFGAIVAAASLAHDIGNPPFGHAGEEAISEYFIEGNGKRLKSGLSEKEWCDLASFEGNAQGFRLLNKSRYQGLKLTYATLAAFTKYPRQSLIEAHDLGRISQKKYGFFQTEKDIFRAVAKGVGLEKSNDLWVRHPLAFLVEAADDICYNLIDLEDGCRLGLVTYEETVGLFADLLKADFDNIKLNKITSIDERIGTLRALAVGKLIGECVELFLDHEKDILKGRFDKALTGEIPSSKVLEKVVALSITKIYRSRAVLETEAAGYEVLPGLLDIFIESAVAEKGQKARKRHKTIYNLLPAEVKEEIAQSENTYQVLRNCIDFIAGLTDTHAISIYRKIKGISHPNL